MSGLSTLKEPTPSHLFDVLGVGLNPTNISKVQFSSAPGICLSVHYIVPIDEVFDDLVSPERITANMCKDVNVFILDRRGERQRCFTFSDLQFSHWSTELDALRCGSFTVVFHFRPNKS